MYSPIFHAFSKTWTMGIIENHKARPCTKEEIEYVCSIFDGNMWKKVENELPLKDDVIIISKSVGDAEGVGMAAYNGLTFVDFDGNMIMYVNQWMHIPPRLPR